MVGRTLIDTFEEVAPGRGEDMLLEYRAFQATCHDDMVKLIPGTREALEKLRASGLRLGVVRRSSVISALENI